MTRVLVVDNHDSFVHTLIGYLHELGADTTIVEADEVDAARVEGLLTAHDALLLSPGPGSPDDAGVSLDAVRLAARSAGARGAGRRRAGRLARRHHPGRPRSLPAPRRRLDPGAGAGPASARLGRPDGPGRLDRS